MYIVSTKLMNFYNQHITQTHLISLAGGGLVSLVGMNSSVIADSSTNKRGIFIATTVYVIFLNVLNSCLRLAFDNLTKGKKIQVTYNAAHATKKCFNKTEEIDKLESTIRKSQQSQKKLEGDVENAQKSKQLAEKELEQAKAIKEKIAEKIFSLTMIIGKAKLEFENRLINVKAEMNKNKEDRRDVKSALKKTDNCIFLLNINFKELEKKIEKKQLLHDSLEEFPNQKMENLKTAKQGLLSKIQKLEADKNSKEKEIVLMQIDLDCYDKGSNDKGIQDNKTIQSDAVKEVKEKTDLQKQLQDIRVKYLEFYHQNRKILLDQKKRELSEIDNLLFESKLKLSKIQSENNRLKLINDDLDRLDKKIKEIEEQKEQTLTTYEAVRKSLDNSYSSMQIAENQIKNSQFAEEKYRTYLAQIEDGLPTKNSLKSFVMKEEDNHKYAITHIDKIIKKNETEKLELDKGLEKHQSLLQEQSRLMENLQRPPSSNSVIKSENQNLDLEINSKNNAQEVCSELNPEFKGELEKNLLQLKRKCEKITESQNRINSTIDHWKNVKEILNSYQQEYNSLKEVSKNLNIDSFKSEVGKLEKTLKDVESNIEAYKTIIDKLQTEKTNKEKSNSKIRHTENSLKIDSLQKNILEIEYFKEVKISQNPTELLTRKAVLVDLCNSYIITSLSLFALEKFHSNFEQNDSVNSEEVSMYTILLVTINNELYKKLNDFKENRKKIENLKPAEDLEKTAQQLLYDRYKQICSLELEKNELEQVVGNLKKEINDEKQELLKLEEDEKKYKIQNEKKEKIHKCIIKTVNKIKDKQREIRDKEAEKKDLNENLGDLREEKKTLSKQDLNTDLIKIASEIDKTDALKVSEDETYSQEINKIKEKISDHIEQFIILINQKEKCLSKQQHYSKYDKQGDATLQLDKNSKEDQSLELEKKSNEDELKRLEEQLKNFSSQFALIEGSLTLLSSQLDSFFLEKSKAFKEKEECLDKLNVAKKENSAQNTKKMCEKKYQSYQQSMLERDYFFYKLSYFNYLIEKYKTVAPLAELNLDNYYSSSISFLTKKLLMLSQKPVTLINKSISVQEYVLLEDQIDPQMRLKQLKMNIIQHRINRTKILKEKNVRISSSVELIKALNKEIDANQLLIHECNTPYSSIKYNISNRQLNKIKNNYYILLLEKLLLYKEDDINKKNDQEWIKTFMEKEENNASIHDQSVADVIIDQVKLKVTDDDYALLNLFYEKYNLLIQKMNGKSNSTNDSHLAEQIINKEMDIIKASNTIFKQKCINILDKLNKLEEGGEKFEESDIQKLASSDRLYVKSTFLLKNKFLLLIPHVLSSVVGMVFCFFKTQDVFYSRGNLTISISQPAAQKLCVALTSIYLLSFEFAQLKSPVAYERLS